MWPRAKVTNGGRPGIRKGPEIRPPRDSRRVDEASDPVRRDPIIFVDLLHPFAVVPVGFLATLIGRSVLNGSLDELDHVAVLVIIILEDAPRQGAIHLAHPQE